MQDKTGTKAKGQNSIIRTKRLLLSTHKIQKDRSNSLFGLRGGEMRSKEEWSRVS